jgi:hypothetical protein
LLLLLLLLLLLHLLQLLLLQLLLLLLHLKLHLLHLLDLLGRGGHGAIDDRLVAGWWSHCCQRALRNIHALQLGEMSSLAGIHRANGWMAHHGHRPWLIGNLRSSPIGFCEVEGKMCKTSIDLAFKPKLPEARRCISSWPEYTVVDVAFGSSERAFGSNYAGGLRIHANTKRKKSNLALVYHAASLLMEKEVSNELPLPVGVAQ